MSARFEVNCDGRNCKEHVVVVVEMSVLSEINQKLAKLREAGWRFTPTPRSPHLVFLCPAHTHGRRR